MEDPVDQRETKTKNTRRQRQQLFPWSHSLPRRAAEPLRRLASRADLEPRRGDRPGDGRDTRPVGMSGPRDHSRLSRRRGRTTAGGALGHPQRRASRGRSLCRDHVRRWSRRGSQRRPQKPETCLPKFWTAHVAQEKGLRRSRDRRDHGPGGRGGGLTRAPLATGRANQPSPSFFGGSRDSYK